MDKNGLYNKGGLLVWHSHVESDNWGALHLGSTLNRRGLCRAYVSFCNVQLENNVHSYSFNALLHMLFQNTYPKYGKVYLLVI